MLASGNEENFTRRTVLFVGNRWKPQRIRETQLLILRIFPSLDALALDTSDSSQSPESCASPEFATGGLVSAS
ncbi:hypothetical protein EYZ11_004920 [Aspergillus tanneri]|uniref:Uncharacterized protein n=1 Tax=Aspergillus tanneri TaxID=1220188 RepID=A0A4S3JJV8_9EURO|nr:hypothetical protein EYZ11_004920 [Aspergillus tanneri]